jgi:radical SAM protein with 4Fe4S-binding SPASM domain
VKIVIEIPNIDYNDCINIIGTAHFTRRSINDAYESISSQKPEDVALELDLRRFHQLNAICINCARRRSCKGLCEFTGAAKALGNVDANIWLIDMTTEEMRLRITQKMTPIEYSRLGFHPFHKLDEDPIWLWEKGFKDIVVNNSKKKIEADRKIFPSIWQVLIDERNALMASRLAWIASRNLDQDKYPKILTFVGAVHVEEIKKMLMNPIMIKENLNRFKIKFTKPTLIRRVSIHWN